MNWNRDTYGNCTSFVFRDNKLHSIQVIPDGHYMITNPNSGSREIISSGFVSGGIREAIEYIESKYVEKEVNCLEPVIEPEELVEEHKEEELPHIIIEMSKTENEDGTLTVSLNSVDGTVIKYTINGKEVITSSKIYKEPFVVNKGTILNAIAFSNKEPVANIKNLELN